MVTQERILWIRLYRTTCWSRQLLWVHLSRRELLQLALYHRIRIDCGWQNLWERSSHSVLRSFWPFGPKLGWARKIRPDTAQIRCSQTELEMYSGCGVLGQNLSCSKTWSCNSFRHDRLRSNSITHIQQPVLKGCPEQQRKFQKRERSRLVLHRLLCSSLIGAMTWSQVLQKGRGWPVLTAAIWKQQWAAEPGKPIRKYGETRNTEKSGRAWSIKFGGRSRKWPRNWSRRNGETRIRYPHPGIASFWSTGSWTRPSAQINQ